MPQIFRKKQAPMKFLILIIWNVFNLMTLSDAHCWNHEGSVLHRLKQVINLNYCFSARSCAIYWTLFFALICLLAIFGLYCFSLGILCYIGILVLVYCYIIEYIYFALLLYCAIFGLLSLAAFAKSKSYYIQNYSHKYWERPNNCNLKM